MGFINLLRSTRWGFPSCSTARINRKVLTTSAYKCTMMISENTTEINMTKFSKDSVKEGTIVEYVCETSNSFCTDSPAVLWFVDDESVNASYVYTNETYSSLTYREMTKSTMTIIADRKLNNKQVKCILENDDTQFKKQNLNVTCKYILAHI